MNDRSLNAVATYSIALEHARTITARETRRADEAEAQLAEVRRLIDEAGGPSFSPATIWERDLQALIGRVRSLLSDEGRTA